MTIKWEIDLLKSYIDIKIKKEIYNEIIQFEAIKKMNDDKL